MDAKTAEALEASIAKWERNAEATEPQHVKLGNSSCALCVMFALGQSFEDACAGCPVAIKAGRRGCSGTPYDKAADALIGWRFWDGSSEAFRAAARAEVEFLKSLREPVAVAEDAA